MPDWLANSFDVFAAREARVVAPAITELDCTRDGKLHVGQWDYVSGDSRFNIGVCSRRAGKSEGAVRKAARKALGKSGARVAYVTLIRRNCKKYFFWPMLELLRNHNAGFDADQSDLIIKLHNGSFIQAFSVSELGDIETVLGDKWDQVIIDEAQSFRDDVIKELVIRGLFPQLLDRKGALDLLGTPPPAGEVGYFWETWAGGKFQRYRWTLFENPWIESSEVQELVDAVGLTPEHAIYKREYLGEFCVDPNSLVFEYMAGRNDVESLPFSIEKIQENERGTWRFSMGLDLGFQDRDAISVVGWRTDDPEHTLYECYSFQRNHQDVDKLAEEFTKAYRLWRPIKVIGDNGGHGATKVLKTLEARLGGIEIDSKPASVVDSIGLMNDELRTGRLKVDPKGIVANDFKLTTWKNGKRGVEMSDSYHSDILAALRYAIHGAQHFRGKAPKPPETLSQQRYRVQQERRRKERDLYGILS